MNHLYENIAEETRYDLITENHGHFKCESCGTIYDFSVDIDSSTSIALNNFKINDKMYILRVYVQNAF